MPEPTVCSTVMVLALVAFPEELTREEVDYWLPYVFYGFGDEGRRNILDFHGGRAADNITPGRDLQLRHGWFAGLDSALARAQSAFRAAAEKGVEQATLTARAIAILRCIYRSIRHVMDFGLLTERARPREGMWTLGERPEGDPERDQVYDLVRDELDNTLELIDLVEGEGTDQILVTASRPEDEDTFLLGPDVADQLRKKRRIMLAHWRDFDRLYLPPHL